MFPLNDFNLVACALATFSAAVGYNVSRRRGRNHSNGRVENKQNQNRLGFLKFHRRNSTASARSSSISPTDNEYDGTEPSASNCSTPVQAVESDESFPDEVEDGLLKRKRSPSPKLMLSDIPPSKRRRTPPAEGSEIEASDKCAVKVEEITSAIVVTTSDDLPQEREEKQESIRVTSSELSTDVSSPQEPLASVTAAVESTLVPTPPMSTTPTAAQASLPTADSPRPFSSKSPIPAWHSTNMIVAAKPSLAFQAFSGKPSAFAGSPSVIIPTKAPIWSASTLASGSSGTVSDEAPTWTSSDADPLAAPKHSTQTVVTVTGEEDEYVVTELKGAKVFVRRGDCDFCEGILGHVKLLKHKETGAERILFRREPVWKVTMSVRLRPTVRCSFDEAQGALRVTLKEPAHDSQQEHLVIYALRRGKASRTDFADFAKAIVQSARLQEQAHA